MNLKGYRSRDYGLVRVTIPAITARIKESHERSQ